MAQQKNLLKTFLKWRYKNVSNRTFVHVASLVVGFLAGLVAVTLKNTTYLIQSLLKAGIIFSENQLYFMLPIVGVALGFLFVKVVL